jgi:hypothetical protein
MKFSKGATYPNNAIKTKNRWKFEYELMNLAENFHNHFQKRRFGL